jgi:hypothetical protein
MGRTGLKAGIRKARLVTRPLRNRILITVCLTQIEDDF